VQLCLEEMEWDLQGVVVRVQVEAPVEEAEALGEWVATALELVPAEIVFARIAGKGCHIRQVSRAIM